MHPSRRASRTPVARARVHLFLVAVFSLTILVAPHRVAAQTSQYTITQITSGSPDHMWPAINNKGDIVWSQQVNGLWQVFMQRGSGGAPTPIAVPDASHNFRFPDISDSGSIVYLKDGTGGGSGLQVMLNQQGAESTVEFSSSGVGAFRDAGQHFGISRNGTIISYYDFCSGGCVRRFDVSTVGTLQCGGVNCDFGGADYPDINDKGDVVYVDPVSGFVGEFTVPNVNPAAIVAGSFARINNSGDLVVVSAGQVQVYLAPDYTKSKNVNAGNWAGINDSGVVVFQVADNSGHQQIFKAVPINSVTLLDPVPDLLCGQPVVVDPAAQCGLTTGADQFATQGRVVQGVAADGVTQVVLRIPTANVGDQFTLTLLNDQSPGQVSSSLENDGGLGNTVTGGFSNQVTVTAVNTARGPMAFALYLAPVDFARTASPTTRCGGVTGSDSLLACRLVSIQVTASSTGATSITPVTILRPPVVLVHGFWDDSSGWNHFLPLFSPAVHDTRFYVGRADYGYQLDLAGLSVSVSVPSYPSWVRSKATNPMASALGVEFNAPHVLSQIQAQIQDFKGGNNPGQFLVAAVQADIVAHSMGGLVARWLPLEAGYLASSTFGQGSVHKLITIDTPHEGTPAATNFLLPENTCVRDLLAKARRVSFYAATINGRVVNGAVGDMEGDGRGGNLSGPPVSFGTGQSTLQFLTRRSPHELKTAMIAGIMTSRNLDGLNSLATLGSVIRKLCGDPLARALTPTDWPGVFGQSSDGIVPLTSQLNSTAPEASLFFDEGYVHSGGIEELGFAGPAVYPSAGDVSFPVSQWQAVPNAVIILLNTPVTDSVFKTLNP